MPDQTATVGALREAVRQFVAERDWAQFHSPKNLAIALTCEAAELLEHFQWVGLEESRQQMQDPARLEQVCDEIADVLWVCLSLVNALDVDLSDAFLRKMARNVLKYPAEQARGKYRIEE